MKTLHLTTMIHQIYLKMNDIKITRLTRTNNINKTLLQNTTNNIEHIHKRIYIEIENHPKLNINKKKYQNQYQINTHTK